MGSLNYMQMGAMQGWQCPICKRVLSPFVQECPCKGQGPEVWTTTTGTETVHAGKNKTSLNNNSFKRDVYNETTVYFNSKKD